MGQVQVSLSYIQLKGLGKRKRKILSFQKPTTIRQRDLGGRRRKDTNSDKMKRRQQLNTKQNQPQQRHHYKNKKPGQQMEKFMPTQQASVPPSKPKNSRAKQPRNLQ